LKGGGYQLSSRKVRGLGSKGKGDSKKKRGRKHVGLHVNNHEVPKGERGGGEGGLKTEKKGSGMSLQSRGVREKGRKKRKKT